MNQCDDNLEHDPDDMHSTCMQKDPVVSIRLFDRNFMLCSAYLHSVNRTSRWHKSGQDINHLAATARTRQHDSARADRGHGDTVKDFQQCDIKTNRARSGAPVPALHHVPVCARPVFWNGVTR